jgi:CubicO group peptidase (beta-lactamase class C family)
VISDERLIESVRTFVPAAMHVTGTPGMTIALAREGKVIWEDAFGYGNLGGAAPMTLENTAPVGSISKLYTAVAVLQLVDRGVVDLYRPINDYLGDLHVVNPRGERHVTAYDLLTFRSGLANDTMEGGFTAPPALDEYLHHEYAMGRSREYHRFKPRWTAKVGELYQYSTLGVATLGYLVQVANPAGLTFPQYVRSHIFRPLEMHDSAFDSPDEEPALLESLIGRFSTGYARFGSTYVATPRLRTAAVPGGALITTAGDHIRLLLALLDDGSWRGREVLSPQRVNQLLTPQVRTKGVLRGLDTSNGLMIQLVNAERNANSFGHAGSYPWGWLHDSRAFPQSGVAFVAFANKWDAIRWSPPTTDIAPSLVAAFLAQLLEGDASGVARCGEQRSWGWKRSYVIGMLLSERCLGLFGPESRPPPDFIDRMLDGAYTLADDRESEVAWDPEGFRAGATDMAAVEMTPTAIRSFTRSGGVRVPYSEQQLVALELGRHSGLPIPMPFFAQPNNA